MNSNIRPAAPSARGAALKARYPVLFVRLLAFVVAVALAVPGLASASPLPTVRTAWLAEHEAFAAWYARERKWDVENGISLELVLFPTGKNLVDNMRAADCVIGGCGGAAAVFGLLDKRVYVIGVASDETDANAVYVRPDSPLLAVRGGNPSYPALYGDAAAMRGKTVLAPLGTSAHQLLYFWLERLGTSDADTIVIDTKPEEALKAFMGGMGDAVALWAPDTYRAEALGLRRAATGRDCGITQPILLIADRKAADADPASVTAFMKTYLKAVEAVSAMPEEELVPLYRRFMRDFAGRDISGEEARSDLKSHRFLSGDEQRALFRSRDEGGLLHGWLVDVIRFHEATGALSRRQSKTLEEIPLATSRFLDGAAAR